LNIYLLLTVCRKDENKEKEDGNGPFKKTIFEHCLFVPTRLILADSATGKI